MWIRVWRRLGEGLVFLLIITSLTFFLMHTTQDDVVDVVYSQQQSLSYEAQAAKREELQLNKPILSQYITWVGQVGTGDLGRSYVNGEPVSHLLASRLPATLSLMATSLGLTIALAIPLGILGALKPHSTYDALLRGWTILGNSLPNFFIALLLIYIVALKLTILPVIPKSNSVTGLILPTITLVISMSAKYIQQVRTLALEELSKPYILAQRTRGLSWRTIVWHTLVPAIWPPLLTLVALSCGSLLGGVTIVESIFMWDGIGKLAYDAIVSRDYPVLQGYVIWVSMIYIVLNSLVDIWQQHLNPQWRGGASDE
ncbi:ABC transporter permease [uncultured Veillonella sp.]|uniref:ABC transporter permease n=1 Tax=uncultured Veillonella sp. TaxID=159268 RepID=UPI002626D5AD|nr:ABC transporter permease [uncultured Veillonella sp.]